MNILAELSQQDTASAILLVFLLVFAVLWILLGYLIYGGTGALLGGLLGPLGILIAVVLRIGDRATPRVRRKHVVYTRGEAPRRNRRRH